MFGAAGPQALVIAGEMGIGKTAIWRRLLEHARAGDFEVLTAMPSGAEVQLTFAALGDLIDGIGAQALERLPAPQRRALEVALLRADGSSVDPRAVAVALLELLRVRCAERPIVIAIDDLQWLDAPSAGALTFALRRLAGAPIIVVATLRSGEERDPPALDLERALGRERVRRLEIGPLTLAAVHELLVTRLERELPRPALVALFDASGGNPFVACELAAELERSGLALEPGASPPVPASVRELVRAKLAALAPEVRELLLAAGALARPTVPLLARIRPDVEATLAAAVQAGIIEAGFERGEVRFTHPLHARVPYEALEPPERRRLHARLAGVLEEGEERARHRALAARATDPIVAGELDAAATAAGARGAPAQAAELSVLAMRLTPAGDEPERARRSLAAAQWHQRAGEVERSGALAAALLESPCAAGETRARAMSVLATVRADTEGVAAALELYDRARREREVCAVTRAEVHRRIAWLRLGAGEVASAGRHARAALTLAEHDPARRAGAAAVAALAAVTGGASPPESLLALASAAVAAEPAEADYWPETSPEVVAAVTLLWAGEIERARPPLERALARATERDEPWLVMHALAYLSALATAAGELELGAAHARRYVALAQAGEQGPQRAAAQWPLAVALGWLGDESEARAAAEEGAALARQSGHGLYEVGCLTALGLLELSLEHGPEAAAALGRAHALAGKHGIGALGRPPLLPNLVEAHVLCGELEAAEEAGAELTRRARRLGSPWALALTGRCEGLLAEARGEHERAVVALHEALAQHARQDRPPERARTELALGRALRRAHQKRAARETLERSRSTFQAIGAKLWAARAERELARIGGRAASAEGRLSATEDGIAQLVAAGKTNQEVALALHISARTVEWNLSKIYRKIGVRGRTELAAALVAGSTSRALVKPGGSPG